MLELPIIWLIYSVAQHDGDTSAEIYYYLHDRLGSVRQIINNDANVVNLYTYEPFDKWFIGDELEETKINNFCFTGQYYEREQRRNSRQLSGFD
ncbi:MAG: hypothetical protein JSV82_01960 [Planctomycetota bacterium]|nr:MAG: hypothetical protein JSV82_01960 [Planctomycetota bacterium]